MFRLHCNKCYQNRNLEPALTFHLTRCYHVLCTGCLNDASKDKKCPLCSFALQTLPINRNMPSGMASYFEDPKKYLQLYRKISKFQCDQRTSDNYGFSCKMEKKPEMDRQLEGYNKLEAQLNKQINLEKIRIAELRNYIAYHEQPEPEISRR